jgi:DNA repair exonuclease SbcCD nuclease subunit
MRLVHLSDTHLGFSAYSRLDPAEGINQREADIYRAFEQAIDIAIGLKPDVVVHSGDLFDTVRPQNRAIDFALRQLIRLSEAGIETVLISGNHSTPRLRETGNIFRIFEHLKNIHPAHEPGAKRIDIGDLVVHAVPHSSSPSLTEIVSKLTPSKDSKYNLLVLHAGILDSDTYRMDEFNEQTVPLDALSDGWDYVALGHFHRFAQVAKNAYYSGSTERLGFGDSAQKKGIIEVDLQSHSVKLHELKIREMVDLKNLDAANLASSEILREAKEIISSSSIDDKIVRLAILNVASDAYKSLDVSAIRRLGGSALHFELKIDRLDADGRQAAGETQIGLLADEFRKYVARLPMADEKKKRLIDLGLPYLTKEEED